MIFKTAMANRENRKNEILKVVDLPESEQFISSMKSRGLVLLRKIVFQYNT